MVQAEVVQVAARVSGEVKAVHVRDNQFVKVGDPLFDLDDRPFRVALSQAEANVRQKQAVAKAARDRAERDVRLQRSAPGAISPEAFQQAEDQLLSAEADVAVAQAQLEQARLNLSFTHVTAPVNGYITNLTVQPGTMSTAYRPLVALINADSFRVDAFFRETQIRDFRPGDRALITLMTYSDTPLEATVESIGWGRPREREYRRAAFAFGQPHVRVDTAGAAHPRQASFRCASEGNRAPRGHDCLGARPRPSRRRRRVHPPAADDWAIGNGKDWRGKGKLFEEGVEHPHVFPSPSKLPERFAPPPSSSKIRLVGRLRGGSSSTPRRKANIFC